MSDNLDKKIANATKWSAVTEVAAKLVTPITSMVLARLLTPEAYGIVATLNMIIVFAEIFTDAGFQKYIIQHEFDNKDDLIKSTNVAFWSNLLFSFLIWGVIAIFADPLMILVGNPGYGNVLIVACMVIPMAAFSSLQMALYRRNLDYKTLFKVRMIGILVPLFVTIPAALYFRSYWALIIGSISRQFINAIVLTYYSKWKPKFIYSFERFKSMFSFTFWSMLESLSVWLVSYFDVFVIGTQLSQYHLGLYKTSSALINQIFSLITATTTTVLFSSLSRLQNNQMDFERIFFKFQKYVGILVIPLGVGIFCFRSFFTNVVLGGKWVEASDIMGLWALVSGLMIVLNHYCGTVYRAKGRPKLSTLSEWFHIIVLWPSILLAVRYGFECLYITRTLMRLEHVLVDMIIMTFIMHISARKIFGNIVPSLASALVMALTAYLLQTISSSIIWQIISIIICAVVYFAFLLIFPSERIIISAFIKTKIRKIKL